MLSTDPPKQPASPNQNEQLQLPFEASTKGDWRSQVPSVSQLSRRLRGHIENSFFDVWVKGEISNFRKPISGHSYFILKDSGAQLRAVMFRNALQKLKFELKDGMEILLHGNVTVYEARGDYQLVADSCEPVGQGALQLAFEQLKSRLEKEGLFDPTHKMQLPFLPKRIGVVTSPTGAAIKDILKVLSRRFENREILILPASVQGEKAAPEIVRAIQHAETWNKTHPERAIDVLIVGRGGGSLEDLWPFNEEIVARAIYQCSIPTISAVGHEIDFTIADFVADLRAPTPSAAAEIAVPKKEELIFQVNHHTNRLILLNRKRVETLRMHLNHLARRLVDPKQKIQQLKESFIKASEKLKAAIQTRLLIYRKNLERDIQMLESLSPLKVLGRGYSLTQSDNQIVRSVKALKPGQIITTRLVDGEFSAQVISNEK